MLSGAAIDPDTHPLIHSEMASHAPEQPHSGSDITQLGYIPKRHWSICQQGGRQNGQSRIFGTRDTNFPCQGGPTINFQLFHEGHYGCESSLTTTPSSDGLQMIAQINRKVGKRIDLCQSPCVTGIKG
jgi:hypothetical protein